ncbi:hypothetical protein FA130_11725, partial [Pseudomonas aeruginosa]|nr:hypothetical protein [Pseudomonas aeruginosa]
MAWVSTTTASTTCWHGCARRSIAAYWGSTSARTSIPRWPQPGNPRPRLFRLPQANAIINR